MQKYCNAEKDIVSIFSTSLLAIKLQLNPLAYSDTQENLQDIFSISHVVLPVDRNYVPLKSYITTLYRKPVIRLT